MCLSRVCDWRAQRKTVFFSFQYIEYDLHVYVIDIDFYYILIAVYLLHCRESMYSYSDDELSKPLTLDAARG